jgi:hypothetical protein
MSTITPPESFLENIEDEKNMIHEELKTSPESQK